MADGNDVSRDRLAELLNEDLAREYQAIIGYVVYSQVLSGAQYMDIAAQLEIHAKQELDHALKCQRLLPSRYARRKMRKRCCGSISKMKTTPFVITAIASGNAKRLVNSRWRNRFARSLYRSRTIKSI
jgi:rubrerythrin